MKTTEEKRAARRRRYHSAIRSANGLAAAALSAREAGQLKEAEKLAALAEVKRHNA